ncbi:plasmid pRiA4b ORF-3 family protein [Nocardia sp. NPDC003693]
MAEIQPPSPSYRGPRRKRATTLRVRATVIGTEPALTRVLEVSSELFLNDLHEVLGWCFGWVGRADHEFRCGTDFDATDAERYISAAAVARGDTALPESEVRLDEILRAPGDSLYYLYDFTDPWPHHLILNGFEPRTAKTPRAACTDGRRDCPADVPGGIQRYEYWSARANPHDENGFAAFNYLTPEDITTQTEDSEPTPFVIEEINYGLERQFGFGRDPK